MEASFSHRVYLKFEINLKPIGRVIIKLDNNKAPRCSSAFLEYLAYYDELRKNDCDDMCFNEDEQNPRVKWFVCLLIFWSHYVGF